MGIIYGQLSQVPTRKDMEKFAGFIHGTIVDAVRKEVQSGVEEIVKDRYPGDLAAEVKTLVLTMAQEIHTLKEERNQLGSHLQLEYQRSRQPTPSPPPQLSQFGLLRILDIDPTSSTGDLDFVLRQESRLNMHDKARARWLMKRPLFQNWLRAPQSTLLLADGAMRLDKISSMSVLTGTLAISLLELPATIVLHFFCGRHLDTDAEDGLSGPHGMLRSLMAQLLLALRPPLPDLSGVDSQEFLRDCHQRTLPALCEIFRMMVEQIPAENAVFCLVDGVSWYEQTQWTGELLFIVGMFKALVKTPHRPVLKVLLTSANRSMRVWEVVNPNAEYISLAPGNVDYMPLSSQYIP